MIPLTTLREKAAYVEERLALRGLDDVAEKIANILSLDKEIRALKTSLENKQAEMNKLAKDGKNLSNVDYAKELKQAIKAERECLQDMEQQLYEKQSLIPNYPHDRVPYGRDSSANICLKTAGKLYTKSEKPCVHWELADALDLIDFATGARIAGSGFPLFIGQGARLSRALVQVFLEYNIKAGYLEYAPPLLVNEASVFGTGQLPDKEEQMYELGKDGLYLIPTAEVPLTNIYRDCIVKSEQLPIKITGYSPCFRREAGSYGKDTRGLNRLHQFDKVEIVQLVSPENSLVVLDEMVLHVEGLLKALELPYRIMLLCAGDMGFASAITYDFEVYAPAQERWLEVSSVSLFRDFQTNRLHCRYKTPQGKTELLHSLNGSALALPRIIACILENMQDLHGNIHLPKILHPLLGKVINSK